MTQILVCQAGSCQRSGSETTLLEMEELVSIIDIEDCHVIKSGCLGLCNSAPGVAIIKRSFDSSTYNDEQFFTEVNCLDKSVEVVTAATGTKPDTNSTDVLLGLSNSRLVRVRERAMSIYRWNEALNATKHAYDQFNSNSGKSTQSFSLESLDDVMRHLFIKAGYEKDSISSGNKISKIPQEIQNYSQWSLENVRVISKHTAVFSFISKNCKRGTPHPRGSGRRPATPIIWHVTMLAEVGKNSEGPLPYIERDYTPISSARDWEQGKCDILIKFYHNGAATSWLLNIYNDSLLNSTKPYIWLSQPLRTLSVPNLIFKEREVDSKAQSIFLLLGGTGIVILPQILHHRNPIHCLGIATHSKYQLKIPLDLIFSCRKDDILLLQSISDLCRKSQAEGDAKGLRRCTLLLTNADDVESESVSSSQVFHPFENFSDQAEIDSTLHALEDLTNVKIIYNRLTKDVIGDFISEMSSPYRVIVSGPSGFNVTAREILVTSHVDENNITILEA